MGFPSAYCIIKRETKWFRKHDENISKLEFTLYLSEAEIYDTPEDAFFALWTLCDPDNALAVVALRIAYEEIEPVFTPVDKSFDESTGITEIERIELLNYYIELFQYNVRLFEVNDSRLTHAVCNAFDMRMNINWSLLDESETEAQQVLIAEKLKQFET